MIYSNEFCDYRLFLCKPDKTQVGEIIYQDLQYNPRFDSYNELDFQISYYNNDVPQTVNSLFDDVKTGYLIKVDIYDSTIDSTPLKEEYFSIVKPALNSGVETIKDVSCISLAYSVFSSRFIRDYALDDSTPTIDIYDEVGEVGVLNILLNSIGDYWSVNYIDASLLNIPKVFSVDKGSFTDIFKQLEKTHNCFIRFDTVNNYLNVYDATTYGTNYGLVLSDENFALNIDKKESSDKIATRLYVYGRNSVNITRQNPTGLLYVDDFSYFYDNGYFSASLESDYATYLALVSSETGTFATLLGELDALEADRLAKNTELTTLNTQQAIIEDLMDVYKNLYRVNESSYDTAYLELVAKEAEVASKTAEIAVVQANIVAKQAEISALGTSLSWASNFTSAQIEELSLFIYEDVLEMKDVSNREQLYDYALAYMSLKSQLPVSISIDSADLFSIPELQDYWENIDVGDFLNIDCSRLGIDNLEMRLIAYNHSVTDKSLTFELSNINELNSSLSNLNKMFKATADTASTLDVKRIDFGLYKEEIESILKIGSDINAEDNNITAGSNYINRRGFMGTDVGSYGELQLLKDKIIFSQDSWENFYTLLSAQGLYMQSKNANGATPTGTDPISRVVITPEYGFQIDQWSSILNDWANVVYIGIDGQFHIDNGYLEMLKYDEATPTVANNKILIDPSVGLKISKNTETVNPATPVWTDMLYINTEGDIVLSDENGNGIILDQFGMDTKFIKWFKNMCWNSSFEAYDRTTYAPLYWEGDGLVNADSSWFGDVSCRLDDTNDYIQQTDAACINPNFYDDVVSATNLTRISFHKKRGVVKVEVLDVDNSNTAYTLTDTDGNTGTYLEFARNDNYLPESYSFNFDHFEHGATTQMRLKFTNTDVSVVAEDRYVFLDAIIIEPDFTGKRPSFYTDGIKSIGTGAIGDLGAQIVVDTIAPTDTTKLWLDIS